MILHNLAAAARILAPLHSRAKKPFIWPLTEAGYRAMEAALIKALRSSWRQPRDDFYREIETWIETQLPANPTQSEIDQAVNKWVDSALEKIAQDPQLADQVAMTAMDAPLFGSFEIAKSAALPFPQTNAWDTTVEAWLKKDANFWIGDKLDYSLRNNLHNVSLEVMQQGLGRRELGRELKAKFGNEVSKIDYQWEVVGASINSRGRHAGQINQLVDYEIDTYTHSTAGDERVCPVCFRLDDHVYVVADSMRILNSIQSIPDDAPNVRDQIKTLTPWVGWDYKKIWTDSAGQQQTGAAYYQLPASGKTKIYLDENLMDAQYLQKIGIGQGGSLHGG